MPLDWVSRQAVTLGRAASSAASEQHWIPKGLAGAEPENSLLGAWKGTGRGTSGTSIAFHPNDRELFIAGPDRRVHRLKLDGGAESGGFAVPNTTIWDISISPDAAHLAAGVTGECTSIFSIETGEKIASVSLPPPEQEEHNHDMRVRYAPNGRMLACGGTGQTLRITDAIEPGRKIAQFKFLASIWAIGWSLDFSRLAVADIGGTVKVYATKTWETDSWRARAPVSAAAFSPGGDLLAVATDAHEIELWCPEAKQVLRYLKVQYAEGKQPQNGLYDIAWSGGGSHIAGVDGKGGVHVWNVQSGEVIDPFSAEPASRGWRIAWAPGNGFLVTAHDGNLVRFWDTRRVFGFKDAPPKPVAAASRPHTLTQEERELVSGLLTLIPLGCTPPLSLLRDLIRLLGGEPVDSRTADLKAHRHVKALIELGFPIKARFGLAALLLRHAQLGDWQPPANVDLNQLRTGLLNGLATGETRPRPWTPPLGALTEAAEAIPSGLPRLLALIGHEAVEADPGLPLRLLLVPAAGPISANSPAGTPALELAYPEPAGRPCSGCRRQRSGWHFKSRAVESSSSVPAWIGLPPAARKDATRRAAVQGQVQRGASLSSPCGATARCVASYFRPHREHHPYGSAHCGLHADKGRHFSKGRSGGRQLGAQTARESCRSCGPLDDAQP